MLDVRWRFTTPPPSETADRNQTYNCSIVPGTYDAVTRRARWQASGERPKIRGWTALAADYSERRIRGRITGPMSPLSPRPPTATSCAASYGRSTRREDTSRVGRVWLSTVDSGYSKGGPAVDSRSFHPPPRTYPRRKVPRMVARDTTPSQSKSWRVSMNSSLSFSTLKRTWM